MQIALMVQNVFLLTQNADSFKMKSIIYQAPALYKLGLGLIHGKNLERRYQYMASFVKRGDLVLEPGCGPAMLADFLPEGVKYKGFDINERFIRYGKRKQRDVYVGNVLEPKNYCQADVVVACDMLHHLRASDRKAFIGFCFNSARKALIICEEGGKEIKANSLFCSLRKPLLEYFDSDGTDQMKIEERWSEKELKEQMEKGFSIISPDVKRKIVKIGRDLVVVYLKR